MVEKAIVYSKEGEGVNIVGGDSKNAGSMRTDDKAMMWSCLVTIKSKTTERARCQELCNNMTRP